MRRIGIMGGTFNPIHMGHLIAAQEVLNSLELDKIVFIPSGYPPHKIADNIAPAADRYEMVKLSIENNDKFDISDIEIKRQGKTYTYDTLVELRNIYTGEELFFIVGYDALRDMDSWRNVTDVFRMTNIIVVNRGNATDEMKNQISNKKDKYDSSIFLVNIPNIDISSTDIRNRCQNNRSIKYLVSDRVMEYIIKEGLYKND